MAAAPSFASNVNWTMICFSSSSSFFFLSICLCCSLSFSFHSFNWVDKIFAFSCSWRSPVFATLSSDCDVEIFWSVSEWSFCTARNDSSACDFSWLAWSTVCCNDWNSSFCFDRSAASSDFACSASATYTNNRKRREGRREDQPPR